ncbi:sensor domain-containing protein [Streptomyces sp. 769]|uniref:sensor domain-containing protein n=1 Tax=Streptomyces sp. 769 TaxID=1262452 RepID=UPI00131A7341|nr:sensor domain-containing protein [Streptomyces sp. 769]
MPDGTVGAATRPGAPGQAEHDDGAQARRAQRGGGLIGGLLAPWRGLVLMLLGWTAAVVSWLLITAFTTLFIWVGFALVPLVAKALRGLADCQLRLGQRWYGVGPSNGACSWERHPGALDRAAETPGVPGLVKGALRVLSRRSTWRDWAWAQVSLVASWFLAVVPLLLFALGLFGVLMPVLWDPWVSTWDNSWYGFIRLESARSANWAAGLGVVWLLVGLWIGPYALRAQAKLARAVLGR